MEVKVLDKGFVRLRNISGPTRRERTVFDADDVDPAQAARMSFDSMNEDRTREEDLKLCNYLMKNWHCYHPSMEVLTANGWKKWDSLGEVETFVIPNTKTKKLQHERLEVKVFDAETTLHCFENNRMSYMVTEDHTMWFKGKYSKEYGKVKVKNMSKWGHFEPLIDYSYHDSDFSLKHAFVGFYLGDGYKRSTNTIGFNLKKLRKIEYLNWLIEELNLNYTFKERGDGSSHYSITIPDWFSKLVNIDLTSYEKKLEISVGDFSLSEIRGIFDGLVNSDGSIKKDRKQIQFSSISQNLLKLFETCATYVGMDAHYTSNGVTAYYGKRTSLESRAEYHYVTNYEGKVYCATSSTGMLIVRGSDTEFGFVCGNTSPFEMVEIWLEMKMPIFVARQFVRHRTASINEVSGRYITLPEDWYIPEVVGGKAKSNKQGQVDNLPDAMQDKVKTALNRRCRESYEDYKMFIGNEVAPEHARLFLHLNHYTHWLWKQDLHNMMHFLALRMDKHAQIEAREYAQAVYDLLSQFLPNSMKLFDEYRSFK